MPLNKEMVIDGIHHYLAESQGIIQVECNSTNNNVSYIYSIVKNGIPMNLSENEMFDSAFPTHPLTQLRELLTYIIENN